MKYLKESKVTGECKEVSFDEARELMLTCYRDDAVDLMLSVEDKYPLVYSYIKVEV